MVPKNTHLNRRYARQLIAKLGFGTQKGDSIRLDSIRIAKETYTLNGVKTSALGTTDANSVGEFLRDTNRNFTHDDQARLLNWWRNMDDFRYDAPKDLFIREHQDFEAFYAYAQSGGTIPEARRRRSTVAPDEVKYRASALVHGIHHNGAAFLDNRKHDEALLHVDRLAQAIRDYGVSRDASSDLGEIFRAIKACGGCGSNATAYVELRPVMDAVWDMREVIMQSASEESHFVDLADVFSKFCTHLRVQGENEKATQVALVVDSLIKVQLTRIAKRPDIVTIRSRVRDALPATVALYSFHQDVAETYGANSNMALGVGQCIACREVFGRESAEGRSKPREAIDWAKEELKRAENLRGQSDNVEKELRDRRQSLIFLEACYIERQNKSDPYRQQQALMRHFNKNGGLGNLIEQITTPLRRAKVMHWRWLVTGKSEQWLLVDAVRLLDERPNVKYLCVLDVDLFRRELLGHLPLELRLLLEQRTAAASRSGPLLG